MTDFNEFTQINFIIQYVLLTEQCLYKNTFRHFNQNFARTPKCERNCVLEIVLFVYIANNASILLNAEVITCITTSVNFGGEKM